MIELVVNGRTVRADDGDGELALSEFLRNTLGLTGTRVGCKLEQCGACRVLVDGAPRASCRLELGHLRGCRIETVESLHDGDTPHPLLRCALEGQAAQCGFCLSGILMSAKALLDHKPEASREDICAALDAHLCRCGAHARIVQAVQAAQKSYPAK